MDFLRSSSPGTGYNTKDWSSGGSASGFISSVGKTFGETPFVINNKQLWSGADNSAARTKAAQGINALISLHKFRPGEGLNIVGFSHGGNVGIQASNMSSRKIDNLITLGTPVRSDYKPNYSMIGRHINVYSSFDAIQAAGGGTFNLSSFAAQQRAVALARLRVGCAVEGSSGLLDAHIQVLRTSTRLFSVEMTRSKPTVICGLSREFGPMFTRRF